MMEQVKAWMDSEGKTHTSLEECQVAEIQAAMKRNDPGLPAGWSTDTDRCAQWIVDNQETILNILTTTATSRPKARKANGAVRKPRVPKVAATEAA